MATLLEKWDVIEKIISDKHEAWLLDYFNDKEKPTMVYQLRGWHMIYEQRITSWALSEVGNWKPNYYKKPTRKDIDRLLEWDKSFALGEDKIFLYYEYGDSFGGKVSGAHNLSKIKQDKSVSFNREDLVPRLIELQQIYAPKEGHAACQYCRKQTPIETLVDYTVIAQQYPNTRKTSKYCSTTCGVNDQMAHEG